MARNFIAASSQYLSNSTVPVSTYPFTIAGWGRLTHTGSVRTAFSISAAGSNDYFELGTTTGDLIRFRARDTASNDCNTSVGFSGVNVWGHLAAVGTGRSDRATYFNGANKATSSNSKNPAPTKFTDIGGLNTGSEVQFWDGDLAEWGLWNVALTDAEIAALGTAGVSPLEVRPSGLVCYWRLLGQASPEPEYRSRKEMTLTGTAHADHCRICY